FFSSRRRHTRSKRDWSSDVCSSDLLNAYLSPDQRRQHCVLEGAARRYLEQASLRLCWSPRVQHKIIGVARTLADMQASQNITVAHLSEAIAYRQTVHSGV